MSICTDGLARSGSGLKMPGLGTRDFGFGVQGVHSGFRFVSVRWRDCDPRSGRHHITFGTEAITMNEGVCIRTYLYLYPSVYVYRFKQRHVHMYVRIYIQYVLHFLYVFMA